MSDYPDTPEAALARLEELADSPPLEITATEGGLAEPVMISPTGVVVVNRYELEHLAGVLRQALAAAPAPDAVVDKGPP